MVLLATFPFFLVETVGVGVGVFLALAPGLNETVEVGVGDIRVEGKAGCGDGEIVEEGVLTGVGVGVVRAVGKAGCGDGEIVEEGVVKGVGVGEGAEEAIGFGATATPTGVETSVLEGCPELPECC